MKKIEFFAIEALKEKSFILAVASEEQEADLGNMKTFEIFKCQQDGFKPKKAFRLPANYNTQEAIQVFNLLTEPKNVYFAVVEIPDLIEAGKKAASISEVVHFYADFLNVPEYEEQDIKELYKQEKATVL